MKKILLSVLLLICALAHGQVNLTLGLKAYYPFSGNANDVSGNNNNPVFNNATLTSDRSGNPNSAYHFNGIDNYMKVNNNPSINMTNQMSIALWVRPTGYYTGQCYNNMLIMKGDEDYMTGNYFLRFSDAYTGCTTPTTTQERFYGQGVIATNPLVQLNQWYSVVWTCDGTTVKLYVNCVLQETASAAGYSFTSAYDLYIGHLNNAQFPYWLNGDLDEVRIYDRAINQDEVNVLGGCAGLSACDTWLKTQTIGSSVKVGDLDVSGNQITVEAEFNRIAPYSGTYVYAGDLVSKHSLPGDVNYLLRPNNAEITTTNGYFLTAPICLIDLNKTYHVALVYNGSTLKFYRNGFLMSQVPATGNLFLNDFITTIGDYSFGAPVGTNFQGYINEVRIWNVARTQAQLQTYMNTSLPSPTTQPGLLAYYTFDNLLNKQGNATWNGTLSGTATINNTNTSCNFIADSCNTIIQPPGISGIINDYTPILAFNICDNKLVVEDATKYNVGDTVVMIQMKGALVDSTNTNNFGTVIDYKNAGHYEFNYVKAKTGNIIELKNKVIRPYDIPDGKVQLIRVPYYHSVNISSTLTCLAWDGNKGGVLVLNASDTITLNANIDVSGKGFRGGQVTNTGFNGTNCFTYNYYYPNGSILAAPKGESYASLSNARSSGKGAIASGGGGGNDHNSGGGGGSNAGSGGFGGYQWDGCGSFPFDNRGIGGKAIDYINVLGSLFMGGGGGAGHCNEALGINKDGGNGGGIAIINAATLVPNAYSIISNGSDAIECTNTDIFICHDGGGGGGAGGAIAFDMIAFAGPTNVVVKGGKGANLFTPTNVSGKVAPGAGGGGGWIQGPWIVFPASLSMDNTGGANGVILQDANNAYGATAGSPGISRTNISLLQTLTEFKPNIDSVRFQFAATGCRSFDFTGFGYTNTTGIVNWQWYFGDGNNASAQNTSHTYLSAGTYAVKLIVTDLNGCKDSITRNVLSSVLSVEAGADTAICSNAPVSVQLHGTGTGNISWTPAAMLDNSSIANPVATITNTTIFYFNVTDATGCAGKDSVTVTINPQPLINTLSDTAVCKGTILLLTTTTGLTNYHWSPGISVSDSLIANPLFTDSITRTLIVSASNGTCSASDTITVTVKPLPVVIAGVDTTICGSQTVNLSASGASTYTWSPATFLSNPNSANPVFSGNASTTYYLVGIASNGCQGKDTMTITVNSSLTLLAPPNKAVCLNEAVRLDGNNGNTVQYLWTPTTYLDNNTIIDPLANPPASTAYSVTITDPVCNFDSTFTVFVTVNPLPVINAGKSNDIDCALRNSHLVASGAIQYMWTPTSTLSNPSIANPVASPTTNTEYIVTGTDMAGCSNKDSVTVLVKNSSNGYAVPNSFTPNGDGKNDCFGIKHWGDAQNVIFIVYNRWGEKVFETTNVTICWDGTYKGQHAEAGTYVYYAKANTACGEISYKGNVLLIR